jgi:hypothetical protein
VISYPDGAADGLPTTAAPARAQDLKLADIDLPAPGRLLVNKVAEFDFNAPNANAFGDEDAEPAHR